MLMADRAPGPVRQRGWNWEARCWWSSRMRLNRPSKCPIRAADPGRLQFQNLRTKDASGRPAETVHSPGPDRYPDPGVAAAPGRYRHTKQDQGARGRRQATPEMKTIS